MPRGAKRWLSSPLSSSSTLAMDPMLKQRRSENRHSSSCSARSVPTRRINESSVGKIPTTRVRRLTSLCSCSIGWSSAIGVGIPSGNACDLTRPPRPLRAAPPPGELRFQHASSLVQLGHRRGVVGLGEHGANDRRDRPGDQWRGSARYRSHAQRRGGASPMGGKGKTGAYEPSTNSSRDSCQSKPGQRYVTARSDGE